MPRQITAFSNPLVKEVAKLRDKKHRRREGLFMAEGLRILTEAREAGFLPRILFFAGGARHPLLALLASSPNTESHRPRLLFRRKQLRCGIFCGAGTATCQNELRQIISTHRRHRYRSARWLGVHVTSWRRRTGHPAACRLHRAAARLFR